MDWGQPCQEGLVGFGWWKARHDPAMCTRSPAGQPYPGLHQKKLGQQVEGRNSAPLLRSGESPPGVLRPALEPPAQEGHGAVGVGPEEGHKDDHRDGTPLLWGQAERVGVVQSGEEKASERPYSGLPVPEGGLQTGEELFTRALGEKTRDTSFKLKQGKFRLDIRKNSLPWGWWGTGTGCPEKLWMPPHWQCSRPGWMGLWATWSGGRCPCPWQGGWN